MVDCCPQQPPMYHNVHTITPQQAIALQQYYHNQQQYHNNYSPTPSTSSSSSHGYPSLPDPDYQRRLNAYCGFNNDPLNRNNMYAYNNYQDGNNHAGRFYDQQNRLGYAEAEAAAQHMQMYHNAAATPLHNGYYQNHHVVDTHVTSSSNPVRESRNRAEKNRRDKMLRSVHELGRIVPLVALASAANKRTDRTGILRLTASFIRIETQLKPGLLKLMQPTIQSFDWEKFLLEHLESILLVVSGSGKIVFVSNTVKDLLGHDPLDMFGRQLSDYTQKNDCDELNKQLKINPDENTSSCTAAEVVGSDDSSDSSTNCSSARQLQGSQTANCNLDDQVLARSFLLRLSRGPKPPSKAAKNEKLDYQLVHVNGHLRLSMRGDPTAAANRQLAKRNRAQQQYTENDVFLVALVRPVKERILSLGEFNVREEYITRHHIDGTIIYTDHRISMVAGYLPGEVTGTPGFKYMHKDDVMWTMIALQQMFCGGKRVGNSCYKMLTKNGKFIFMRTHGYIELADDRETVQSFVCINTVVTQQEFDKLNKEMKENFSPVMNQRRREISNNTERTKKEALPNVIDHNLLMPEVEDPIQLQKYIKNLLVEGIPSVPSTLDTPEDCKEIENFMNVVTKNIPPVSYLNQQMNLNPPVVKVVKSDEKKTPDVTSDLTMKMQQQRPSVLRRIVSTREQTTSYEGCSVSKRMRTEVGAVGVQEAPRATVLMSPCQTLKRPMEAEPQPPPPPAPAPLSPPSLLAVADYSVADNSELKLLFNTAAATDFPCPFDATETNLGELVAEQWMQTPTNIEYETLQIVEGLTKTQSHLELRLQKQTQSLTEITENLEMIQPSDLDDNDISTIARLRDLTETTTQQLSEQEVTLRDLQRDTQSIFLEGHNYPSRADAGDLQFLNNVDL